MSVDFGQSYSGLTGYNQVSSNSEISCAGDRWDATIVTHYEYYAGSDDRSTYQSYGRVIGQRYIRGNRSFLFPYAFLGRQTTSDGGSGQIRQYGGGAGWTFRRLRSDQLSFFGGVIRSNAAGFTMLSEEERADRRVRDVLWIAAISWGGS